MSSTPPANRPLSSPAADPAPRNNLAAKFVSGSIMRHILVMTTTNTAGLIGVFLVDLLDIFFLSMLDNAAIVAGVGFAASLSFFTVSLSIGFSISMSALVSRMIGQQRAEQARRYVINVALMTLVVTSALALLIWLNLESLFRLLGAEDEALAFGIRYLQIILVSLPALSLSMSLSASIRAIGDARLSMFCTLTGGFVNAILTPLFIFGFDWGVEGAALGTVFGHLAAMSLSIWGVHFKHQLTTRFSFANFKQDLRPIFTIAGPAMLTNVVTPLGNAIVIHGVADYGAAYVAGFAIIARIAPVAFALIFALSGAVAPIIGQNYGARQYERIQQTLRDALLFNAAYVTVVALIMYLSQDAINHVFSLEGDAAQLMSVFCTWVAITYMFNGAQFISNASFNNLGKPIYATWFNVGRSTIGTLPFVYMGGKLGGAPGVLLGYAAGGILFAIAAVYVAFQLTQGLTKSHH